MKLPGFFDFGRRSSGYAMVLSAALLCGSIFAGTFPESTQTEIDDALAQLSEWAGDPMVVDAVKKRQRCAGQFQEQRQLG